MPCYHPLTGYWSKAKTENGKRTIVFNAQLALNTDFKLQVPCGQCIGCRLEYARVWALRSWHESQMHEHNCFITLTYDDDHLPDWASLVPDHFTKFLKRLRIRHPFTKIRFIGCGEYGDKSDRPHYHAILFGYDFPDKKYHAISKSGELTYTSKELESLWPYGFSLLGSVTFQSCSYVARYVLKKQKGVGLQIYAQTCRVAPFFRCSRKPGIANTWFERHRSQVEQHLYVRSSEGQKSPLPRYYQGLLSEGAKIRFESNKIKILLNKKTNINYDFYSTHEILLNWERAYVLETIKQRQICDLRRNLNE